VGVNLRLLAAFMSKKLLYMP